MRDKHVTVLQRQQFIGVPLAYEFLAVTLIGLAWFGPQKPSRTMNDDVESVDGLRSRASTCRDLASSAETEAGREVLAAMAESFDRRELALENFRRSRQSARPAFRWENG
jgi:hypothetical protein